MPSGSEPSWRVLIALLVYNGEKYVIPCLTFVGAPAGRPPPGRRAGARRRQPRPGVERPVPRADHRPGFLLLPDAPQPRHPAQHEPGPAAGGRRRLRRRHPAQRRHGPPVEPGADDSAATPRRPHRLLLDGLVQQLERLLHPQRRPGPAGRRSRHHRLAVRATRRGVRRAGDHGPLGGRLLHGHARRGRSRTSASWTRSSGAATPRRSTGASAATPWGYRSVLAPSCFVYHAGSGITEAEGIIGDGDKIVHAHQAIIDERYPLYRSQLIALERLEHRRGPARARAAADRDRRRRANAATGSRRAACTRTLGTGTASGSGSTPTATRPQSPPRTRASSAPSPSAREACCPPSGRSWARLPPRSASSTAVRVSTEVEAGAIASGTPVLHRAPYRERVF